MVIESNVSCDNARKANLEGGLSATRDSGGMPKCCVWDREGEALVEKGREILQRAKCGKRGVIKVYRAAKNVFRMDE